MEKMAKFDIPPPKFLSYILLNQVINMGFVQDRCTTIFRSGVTYTERKLNESTMGTYRKIKIMFLYFLTKIFILHYPESDYLIRFRSG